MKFKSSRLALLILLLSAPNMYLLAQTEAPNGLATSALEPVIDTLQQALGAIQLDRWKASGAVRAEEEANLSSIRRDLDSTLPPLLRAADGAPGSLSNGLAVAWNIHALYDVLLRISSVARLSAPRAQSDALEDARASLEDARRALEEQLQTKALAEEQQMKQLRATLDARPASPAAHADSKPCVPSTPPRRKSAVKKAPSATAAAMPSKD